MPLPSPPSPRCVNERRRREEGGGGKEGATRSQAKEEERRTNLMEESACTTIELKEKTFFHRKLFRASLLGKT